MADVAVKAKVVAVRFQPLGKLYYFDASRIAELKVGDWVLVTTSRGSELGQVAAFVENPGSPPGGGTAGHPARAGDAPHVAGA